MTALVDLLAARSPRERGLLGLLVVVILPLAVAFGILQPLMQSRDAARAAVVEAQALQRWVAARAAEAPPLAPGAQAPAPAAIGASGLEQSLVEAGLRDQVSALSNRASGVVELRFDAVAFSALTDWLDRTIPVSGYEVTAFRIDRGGDAGLVAAEFRLRPAPAP